MGEDGPLPEILTVYRSELCSTLARVALEGGVVWGSGEVLDKEMLAVRPSGIAVYAKQYKSTLDAMTISGGWRVVGALRKSNGAFRWRSSVDCGASDIQLGDRVRLEAPDGSQITTRPLRHDWGAEVLVEAAQ